VIIMAQPYLDSAGNVNTAVANDVQNYVFAVAQNAALGSLASTQAAVQATATQVFTTDAVTGLTNTAVTDV
jgi:hypothetical protein